MVWLILVVIGVICGMVGAWAPLPSPMPRVLICIGIVLVVIGIALLLYGVLLVSTGAHPAWLML